MKKYFKTRKEAVEEASRRNWKNCHVFKMPKGTRHHGEYAVCSHIEFLNTYWLWNTIMNAKIVSSSITADGIPIIAHITKNLHSHTTMYVVILNQDFKYGKYNHWLTEERRLLHPQSCWGAQRKTSLGTWWLQSEYQALWVLQVQRCKPLPRICRNQENIHWLLFLILIVWKIVSKKSFPRNAHGGRWSTRTIICMNRANITQVLLQVAQFLISVMRGKEISVSSAATLLPFTAWIHPMSNALAIQPYN